MKTSKQNRRHSELLRLLISCAAGGIVGSVTLSCGDSQTEVPTSAVGDKTNDKGTAQPASQSETKNSPTPVQKDPTKFWLETLKPSFEKNCVGCHTPALAGKANGGPLTIFSSSAMLALIDKNDATETTLYRKITGQITHGGSNQCAAQTEVCTMVTAWHATVLAAGLIAGASTGSGTGNGTTSQSNGSNMGNGGNTSTQTYTGFGQVTSISGLGKILGFAINPAAPETTVEYAVFIDGTNTTGVKLVQAAAAAPGYDRDMPGDHRFEFQIPESYRNGKKRSLHVYSVVGGNYELINGGQTDFYGYVQTLAGKDFYTAQVQPLLLSSCQGSCHIGSMNYETNFGWLMTPAKHQGATATNNSHINNPATANGEGHGGGNRCGSVNSGVCQKLQEWWQIEFGSL